MRSKLKTLFDQSKLFPDWLRRWANDLRLKIWLKVECVNKDRDTTNIVQTHVALNVKFEFNVSAHALTSNAVMSKD